MNTYMYLYYNYLLVCGLFYVHMYINFLTPANRKKEPSSFKKSFIKYKIKHDEYQHSFTEHPAKCRHEEIVQQYSHSKTAFLNIIKHTQLTSIYNITSSLTLYSVAVSMPLTKVASPSSNAIQRFKWRKCCG